MARKNKVKQQKEFLKSLFKLVVLGGFFGTYCVTSSWSTSCKVAGFLIVSLFMIQIVQQERHNRRLKQSGIADIDRMDGIQFEHYLKYLFNSQGYSVKVTRAIGDYGADLVLAKDGKKIVVQAKRHSKDIGIKAVQEVHASMNYYHASEAWVISNRSYTDAAITLAKSNGVRLIDRKKLIKMILEMNTNAGSTPKQILREVTLPKRICKRCGQLMVLRKGAKGEFFGCSTYPKCRSTQPIT